MSRPDELPDETTVEGQATAWFARQRSGEMTPEQVGAFENWMAADPRHRLIFEALEAIWGGFGQTRDDPEILAMRAMARQRPPHVRRRTFLTRLAAGFVAAVCLSGGIWVTSDIGPFMSRDFPDQTFRTDIGQRSTVTLPDGSVVTLNTDTVMRTKASADERLIYLDKGQAFFRVAKNKEHPFIVHAGGRTVTAIGTAFDVRADAGRFEVTLVEGKVRVETPLPRAAPVGEAIVSKVLATPQQATELVPGTQFIAAVDEERWSVRRTDAAKDTAWVTGWLKFDRAPLSEVVDELGRYSTRKIVLADPGLGLQPISGRFKAGDVEGFVEALAVYGLEPVPSAVQAEIRLGKRRG